MNTHSADLNLPLKDVMPVLRQGAEAYEMQLQEREDGAELRFHGAEITLSGGDAACRLTLRAEDPAWLVQLQEILSHFFEYRGFSDELHWARTRSPGLPANVTVARIGRSDRISPAFHRIRLTGDFSRFSADAMHFRLLYGPKAGDLPRCDETGTTTWPGGVDNWHRPPYTVRAIDPEGGWIDVDIFLHDGGRVTDWLARTQVGDRVALSGPGGKTPQAAPWVAYLGDETALPVVARALERLPADACGVARIIISDPADVQTIRHPTGVDLQWIARAAGDEMLTALRQISFPEAGRYVFFAGERDEAAAAREILAQAGLQRSEFHAFAYWTRDMVPPPGQITHLHRLADLEAVA